MLGISIKFDRFDFIDDAIGVIAGGTTLICGIGLYLVGRSLMQDLSTRSVFPLAAIGFIWIILLTLNVLLALRKSAPASGSEGEGKGKDGER